LVWRNHWQPESANRLPDADRNNNNNNNDNDNDNSIYTTDTLRC